LRMGFRLRMVCYADRGPPQAEVAFEHILIALGAGLPNHDIVLAVTVKAPSMLRRCSTSELVKASPPWPRADQ
jgi:hypothetical protein